MSASDTGVRLYTEHDPAGDFHEWIYASPIKCDRRGHPNPRLYSADWQLWRCNNADCPASAVVSNDAVRKLLDGASR